MSQATLRERLQRLGLKQTELAQLLGVSPRTISLWATGEQALPGPAAGYLRLLEEASSATRDAEFRRLDDRNNQFDEGIYLVSYRGGARGQTDGDSAVAILRSGRIVGADRHGGIFRGSYDFDPSSSLNNLHLRLEVPPFGVLINGVSGGSKGLSVDIIGSFKRASPTTKTTVNVAGVPVEIELTYVEPLPN
jgi:transcriptional regulator with XRE-family HTH domain